MDSGKKGKDRMEQSLAPGLTGSRRVTVDAARTIDFMGDEARVYATPALVGDIEHTCRDLIVAHLPAGQDSVGTIIDIAHLAPTPLGMEVTVTVSVAEIDGRRVVFDVSASDPLDTICKGRHERFVVDTERTVARLKAKAARASDG